MASADSLAGADLGALVASRICHDLVNPLGAIGNGVELLELDRDPRAPPRPELALIGESTAHATARTRLFRLAFGVAQPGQEVAGAEMQELLADLSAGGRLALTWEVVGTVARNQARLAMLCMLCLETAMPWGGAIRLSRQGARWQIRGEAERLRELPQLWTVFDGGPGSVAAGEVQFALAPLRAAELAAELERRHGEGEIRLEFTAGD